MSKGLVTNVLEIRKANEPDFVVDVHRHRALNSQADSDSGIERRNSHG